MRTFLFMQIVKQKLSKKTTPTTSTTIFEYQIDGKDISGAVAEINGRYPEAGFAINSISKELVYVVEGKGEIGTTNETVGFEAGDVLLIDKEEKFFWNGNFTIFMVTTPKFTADQHKIVD